MPRLRKGEIAPGVAAKSQRILRGLRARIAFLDTIVESGIFPEGLTAHRTVPELAAWDDPSLGIFHASINGLKAHEVDFASLVASAERVRTLETRSRTQPRKPSAIDKAESARNRISELNNLNQSLTDQLIELRTAYLDVLSHLAHSERENRSVQEALRIHFKRHKLRSVFKDGDVQSAVKSRK